MPIRTAREIPKVEARHRWAINILAAVDTEATLGFPTKATDITAAIGVDQDSRGNIPSILKSLKEVGTVQSLDIGQRREVTQRVGFNGDPLQPFQTVPHGSLFSLKLNRVVLKKLPEVESSFQFFPSNLLLQQLPFVLDITDIGDGSPATFVRHVIFGCWFVDSSVRYDVSSKDDTMLIQTCSILPGRVLTFDPSIAGSPITQAASQAAGIAFQAIQTNSSARNLLEDLELG